MIINNDFLTSCQPNKIISYVDTIGIFFRRFYPIKTIKILSKLKNVIVRKFMSGTWIQIQQPNKLILRLIRNLDEGGQLTNLDQAIDIECDRPLEFADFLSSDIQQKYRRKNHRQHKVEQTTYFREKRQVARNIVIYGDRSSKVTGRPCVHIELRLKGAETIKALGLTIENLVAGIDVLAIFDRLCKAGKGMRNLLDEALTKGK